MAQVVDLDGFCGIQQFGKVYLDIVVLVGPAAEAPLQILEATCHISGHLESVAVGGEQFLGQTFQS